MNGAQTVGDRVQAFRRLALADVIFFPIFVLWYIWRGQFVARWSWIFFAVWMAGSFLIHRDSQETLGWRTDNLRPGRDIAADIRSSEIGTCARRPAARNPQNYPQAKTGEHPALQETTVVKRIYGFSTYRSSLPLI